SFLTSCPILEKKAKPVTAESRIEVSESLWRSLCQEARRARGNRMLARLFFEQRFIPYRITNNGRDEGLFTGYYEPVLYGSYTKYGDFKYPLYMKPPDLKDGTPYHTHADIN